MGGTGWNSLRDAEESVLAGGSVVSLPIGGTGITGATAASRYVGATVSGPPTSGTFAVGDFVVSRADGTIWRCLTAGVADSTSYRAVILSDTPTAYWRLNDSTALVFDSNDSTGNGNAGLLTGGVTTGVTGPVTGGGAMTFNGTTGKISFPKTANPSTIKCWVKTTYAGGGQQYFWSNRSPITGGGISFGMNAGHLFAFTSDVFNGVAVINDGNWHEVGWTFDGTTQRFIVDGVLDASIVLATSAITHGQSVAWEAPNNQYFAGSLSEVATYPVPLALARFQAHNNARTIGAATFIPDVTTDVASVNTLPQNSAPISVATFDGGGREFNVRSTRWNAEGNGYANDQPAISNCQTSARKKGIVFFPDGVAPGDGYSLDSHVTMASYDRFMGTWTTNGDPDVQGSILVFNIDTRITGNLSTTTFTTSTLTDSAQPWGSTNVVGRMVYLSGLQDGLGAQSANFIGIVKSQAGTTLTLTPLTSGTPGVDNSLPIGCWSPGHETGPGCPPNNASGNYVIIDQPLRVDNFGVSSNATPQFNLLANLAVINGAVGVYAPNGWETSRVSMARFFGAFAGYRMQGDHQWWWVDHLTVEGGHGIYANGEFELNPPTDVGGGGNWSADVFWDRSHIYSLFCPGATGGWGFRFWPGRESGGCSFVDLTMEGCLLGFLAIDGTHIGNEICGVNTENNGESPTLSAPIFSWGNNAAGQATLKVTNPSGTGWSTAGRIVTVQGGGASGDDISLPILSGGGTGTWTLGVANPTVAPSLSDWGSGAILETGALGAAQFAALLPNTTYTVVYTYSTPAGESQASPSASLTTGNDGVTRHAIKVAPIQNVPLGVTAVNFYLTAPSASRCSLSVQVSGVTSHVPAINAGVLADFLIVGVVAAGSAPGTNTTGNLTSAVNAQAQNTAGGAGVTYDATHVNDSGASFTTQLIGQVVYAGTPGSGITSGTVTAVPSATQLTVGNGWSNGTPANNSGYSVGNQEIRLYRFSNVTVTGHYGQSFGYFFEGWDITGPLRYDLDLQANYNYQHYRLLNSSLSNPAHDPNGALYVEGTQKVTVRRPTGFGGTSLEKDRDYSGVPGTSRIIVGPAGGATVFAASDNGPASGLGAIALIPWEFRRSDASGTRVAYPDGWGRLRQADSGAPSNGSSLATHVTSATSSGTDKRFTVTIVVDATGVAANQNLCTITFAHSFQVAPQVVCTDVSTDATLATVRFTAQAVGLSTFQIWNTSGALTLSKTYIVQVVVEP